MTARIYTEMVGKHRMKLYVTGIIGEGHVVPTLQIVNQFKEIGFKRLPTKFVIKCNHGSGSTYSCKDKVSMNKEEMRKILTKE